jgi:cytochrome P450 family 110
MLPDRPDMNRYELFSIYFKEPFKFLLECFEKYGDIFTLNFGDFDLSEKYENTKWVILTNPEHIKAMFAADPEQLQAGQANQIFFRQFLPPKGLLSLDGKEQLKRKNLLLKYFQGEQINRYTAIVRNLTQKTVKTWIDRQNFSLIEHIQAITESVMVSSVFGIEAIENQDFQKMCLNLRQFVSSDINLEQKIKLSLEIKNFLLQAIEKLDFLLISAQNQEPQTILEVLLAGGKDPDQNLSHEAIRDEVLTLIQAGSDTTAVMLSWAFECILSHPEVYHKIKIELDQNLSELSEQKTAISLPYLDSAIKETLRLRVLDPIGVPRMVKKSWNIGPYTLPEGTIVCRSSYLLHLRPELYPEPHKFKPERFETVRPNPSAWTPFGGGVRTCLGMNFALHEMKIVLATVLSMVRLELAQPVTKPVLKGSFYIPEGGPTVRVVERF